MRTARRGWTMPEEDALSVLRLIEERIRASNIQVERRDVLIRLRDMIEDDLAALAHDTATDVGSPDAHSESV